MEEMQGYHDDPLTKCPECSKNQLRRLLFVPHISIIGQPTTLQHQAVRNTERAGHYEREEKQKDLPVVSEQDKLMRKLSKLDKKGKKNYIEKGILPS